MSKNRVSAVLGILLLVAGGVLLLQNLKLLGPIAANAVWLLLFGLGGLAFLLVFAFDREQWWALIPGLTLLGLAMLLGFGDRLGSLGAAIFLGCIGLSFLLIALLHRERWWAILPGGSLFSVAALVALEETIKSEAAVGVMFLGLAATFLLLYLLPSERKSRRWALIPAGVLAAIGVLMMVALGGLINSLGALALIAGGVFILWRTLRPRT